MKKWIPLMMVILLISISGTLYLFKNYTIYNQQLYKKIITLDHNYTLYSRMTDNCTKNEEPLFSNGYYSFYALCEETKDKYIIKKGKDVIQINDALQQNVNDKRFISYLDKNYFKTKKEIVELQFIKYGWIEKDSISLDEYKQQLIHYWYYYNGQDFEQHNQIEIDMKDLNLNKVGTYYIDVTVYTKESDNTIQDYFITDIKVIDDYTKETYYTPYVLIPKIEYKYINPQSITRENYENQLKHEICSYNQLSHLECEQVNVDASLVDFSSDSSDIQFIKITINNVTYRNFVFVND